MKTIDLPVTNAVEPDALSPGGHRPGAADQAVSKEPFVIDETSWAELNALTGGAAALCYQCGVCTAACPWGLVREQTFSVRSLMRNAQLGLDAGGEELWLCTTCGQCEGFCPRGVDIGDVMRGLRHLAWQNRQTPPGLPAVLWSLHGNNNPWGQPPSTRSMWAGDLGLPYFDPDQHELLLYIGCTAAYDRRIQNVARALVNVLRAAGVAFGTLADDEPCCGESVLSMGHRPFFDELIGAAAHRFRQHGVSRLVTISPHCFDAFKTSLPAELPGVEFQHYPQFLAQLVAQGRLAIEGPPLGRATFHDPCYLVRHHDDISSARVVLNAIPAIDLVEMAHYGPETLCCGGGGGRMWLETAPDERIADRRIAEAVEVEAELLITACPFCLACLEDSLKTQKLKDLRILDLAELLDLALTSDQIAPQDERARL